MKSLSSISSLNVLSREEQSNVFGGTVIGGFSCKGIPGEEDSGGFGYGEYISEADLRATASRVCSEVGGVGTVFFFEDVDL